MPLSKIHLLYIRPTPPKSDQTLFSRDPPLSNLRRHHLPRDPSQSTYLSLISATIEPPQPALSSGSPQSTNERPRSRRRETGARSPTHAQAPPSMARRCRRTQPSGLRPAFTIDQDRSRPSLSLRSTPLVVSLSLSHSLRSLISLSFLIGSWSGHGARAPQVLQPAEGTPPPRRFHASTSPLRQGRQRARRPRLLSSSLSVLLL